MLFGFLSQRMVSFPDRWVLPGEEGDKPAGHVVYRPRLRPEPMSPVGG